MLLLLRSLFVQGQDIHFSQFYNQPLLLNPALTGTTECNMNAGLNYRSQGKSITVPYVTQSGFFDYKIVPEFIKRDWAGVGISLYQDEAGDGSLKTSYAAFYASYHKGLDYDNSKFASFGANIGYASKSVEYSTLLFDSQWNGYKFSPLLSNHEPNNATSVNYLDFSAGTMFTYSPSVKFSSFMGVSLQHINNPKETYYNDVKNQIGRKLVIHGGVDYKISTNLYLQPKFMFAKKKQANEFIIGSNVLFIKNDIRVHGGLWTRLTRDIIFLMGAEFKRMAVFISYDYNFSDLNIISQSNGGFEISLVTHFDNTRKRKAPVSMKTPAGVITP